jgi:hypothetical protein
MPKRAIILVIGAAVVVGCSDREGTARTLTSGKVIRLLFAGVVDDSYSVEYCTELALSDRRALAREADEIIDEFRADAVASGVSKASLWPTVCRWRVRWAGWRPVIVGKESTAFTYWLGAGGAWTRPN